MRQLLEGFMPYIASHADLEIYNEFSLQHELGIFLRERALNYRVQFERNTSFFGIKGSTVKREIDIVLYSREGNMREKYAIELKYPRNGEFPNEMFKFIQDIRFMEELKENGFDRTFVLTVVEQEGFYLPKREDGSIYRYFRPNGGAAERIHGCIKNPAKRKPEEVTIAGSYDIVWHRITADPSDKRRYYLLEIQP